jgi:thioredoxin 1
VDPLLHLTETDFDAQVLKAAQPVLVEFGAEWCKPCKSLLPILSQLQTEWAGKIYIYQVDVDQHPDLAVRNGVMGLPTLIFFKNGQALERLTGLQSREKIVSKINAHL